MGREITTLETVIRWPTVKMEMRNFIMSLLFDSSGVGLIITSKQSTYLTYTIFAVSYSKRYSKPSFEKVFLALSLRNLILQLAAATALSYTGVEEKKKEEDLLADLGKKAETKRLVPILFCWFMKHFNN